MLTVVLDGEAQLLAHDRVIAHTHAHPQLLALEPLHRRAQFCLDLILFLLVRRALALLLSPPLRFLIVLILFLFFFLLIVLILFLFCTRAAPILPLQPLCSPAVR